MPTILRASENPAGGVGNFVPESLFRFLLDLELRKALRLQYPVAVLCLTPDLALDPPVMPQIVRRALQRLRATDLLTTLSAATFGLILVDADLVTLPAIFERLRLQLSLLTVDGIEHRCRWSGGGSAYPWAAARGTDLLEQARELMSQAKTAGGDRLLLTS